ncbi:MAG: FAD-dependent oxidoreductase [Dehalococcoidia bacterium]|nr:FAD-dependent oxidoreductase [Dehalococcoidia bacterium]
MSIRNEIKRIQTASDLENLQQIISSGKSSQIPCISLCAGTGCRAAGSEEVRDAFIKEIERSKLQINLQLKETGCHGFCERGPIVVIHPKKIFYEKVHPEDVSEIITETVLNGRIIERLLYIDPLTSEKIVYESDVPFYKKQQRIILGANGDIDPTRIEDYIATKGYSALSKVMLHMSPGEVIEEVKKSGLRGRGGAGFSTGGKWELCRQAKGDVKYVICNADEGDPGAYMNRSLLEGNPHSVIEGMIIGGYAMGSNEGIIYVRDEYPLAVKHCKLAIETAREYGLLGHNILNSGFNFDIKISMGAGAFVCGEETALIASIEGGRGTPRQRPPFPAQRGLWNKPTNINNVETWTNIPLIISNGAGWFSQIGTAKSKGTKIFSLVGKINNTGLVEVPLGTTIREIIYDIGGGIPGNRQFKAVQTGGPSGGCIPSSHLDLPIDYESLKKAGSIMGSGGMIVMDENTCMVDIARYYTAFLNDESCGKCLSCRKGTQRMKELLTDITQGKGREGDIELLEELASTIRDVSLCGLGQTAGNPVLATIRYFRDEYEDHIKRHHCRAGVCKALVKSPCQNACPAGIDVPRYIRLIHEGKTGEAVAVIREKVPFPAVLGYVCLHFCEQKCRRGDIDEALAIKMLKRFAADHDDGSWKKKTTKLPSSGKKAAVIGSGPAGLTAAYYLAKQGHEVTVFEAAPVTGGMMRLGIPEFRLPRDILDREIDDIKSAGINIKVNSEVESLDALFRQGYSAIFTGIGAYRSRDMGIDGEDDASVLNGIEFLRNVNLGIKMDIGDRVLVVGGGNAAIDSARTALRLGVKEVAIAYRRTYAAMPASVEEVKEAIEEGVKLDFLVTPVRVSRLNGRLKVEFLRMALGNIDDSGRRQPVPIKGSEFTGEYDTIIKNIGDRPEVPGAYELVLGKGGEIKVDPDTLATSKEGVFAGGDAVSGPASVIEAIAAGRQAAISIDRFLGGKGDIEEKLAPAEEIKPFTQEEGERRRPPMCMLSHAERKSFALVELGYDQAKATEEAKRCLRCDLEEH